MRKFDFPGFPPKVEDPSTALDTVGLGDIAIKQSLGAEEVTRQQDRSQTVLESAGSKRKSMGTEEDDDSSNDEHEGPRQRPKLREDRNPFPEWQERAKNIKEE